MKERKLKEMEKDYPTYLEQQAELEDPLRRLEVIFFHRNYFLYYLVEHQWISVVFCTE